MIHRRAEMAFGYRRHRGLWLTLRLVAATQTPQFIYHALQLVDMAMFNPPILNPRHPTSGFSVPCSNAAIRDAARL
jgi:hypothetical protein